MECDVANMMLHGTFLLEPWPNDCLCEEARAVLSLVAIMSGSAAPDMAASQAHPPYVGGVAARKEYPFFVIISRTQWGVLEEQGRVRLGRYTALRQHAPDLDMNYDGIAEAIARNEHVSGQPRAQWPVA